MLHPDGHPFLASIIDLAMAPLARVRPGVIGQARGRVLEIGCGTGLNFALYGAEVTEVVAVEPDPHMLRRARPRAQAASVPITLRPIGAEALDEPSASFDTVVFTFVLCTLPDPDVAIARAVEALRPGGRVLWVEHTRASCGVMRGLQRLVDPLWTRFAGGCHLTRDPTAMLRAAGVGIDEVLPCGTQCQPVPVSRGVAHRSAQATDLD